MKRLKGVRSNLSGVKVPPVLDDLYWDLRDRRLLPLALLIVVSIVAIPFLLGGDGELEPSPETPSASISSALDEAKATSLVVVESKPGLRDYRKRLAGRTPTDPFEQHQVTRKGGNGAQLPEPTDTSSAATSPLPGGDGGSGDSSGDSSAPIAPDVPNSDSGSSTPGSRAGKPAPTRGGDGDGKKDLTFYTFAIDARITRAGGSDSETRKASKQFEPVIQKKLLPLTAVPGEKAPVVTYMGASKKGKALLMVSNDVKAVFGETKCISGDDICQLLEAEPGFPVTFVYGAGEIRYTIKVLKIYPVVTGRR